MSCVNYMSIFKSQLKSNSFYILHTKKFTYTLLIILLFFIIYKDGSFETSEI